MNTIEAQPLFTPDSEELRFLPEGPYPLSSVVGFSWVAIQHGADADVGSLNLYRFDEAGNRSFELPGRPGFAFATEDPELFVVGMERRVVLFHLKQGVARELCSELESGVSGTIINDGVAFEEGLIFGCKDLSFETGKAGLYFWRRRDGRTFRLRSDQVCSNGKVVRPLEDGRWELLDIDTPTKTVVRSRLDIDSGEQTEPEVVLDLSPEEFFPDGMVASPDGQSVIIAMYNPNDRPHGEARQYDLQSRRLETIWRTPGSPQVTCPLLLSVDNQIKLILTTAVEKMSAERREKHGHAGTLFMAETDFDATPPTPLFQPPA